MSSSSSGAAGQNPSGRILGTGVTVSNDTRATHMNNNDNVVGPTGSGKTRGYVIPNLLQMNESVIVTDTKGTLVREVGPVFERHGYEVCHIDFTDLEGSIGVGYNPLDYIRRDPRTGAINEQDVMTLVATICPIECLKDPFWDYTSRLLLDATTGLVVESGDDDNRNLNTVAQLASVENLNPAFEALAKYNPKSFAVKKYNMYKVVAPSEKTATSVRITVMSKLEALVSQGTERLYSAPKRIDFKQLGQKPMALFLTVSDTDHSLDRLVTLLYAQAIHALCDYADDCCPGGALPVPVRLYLDDFATNCVIPDFDKIISVIRSRNIAVSVVLQSITQLDALYGSAAAQTIVNGCDHMVYLGGRDLQSARYVAEMANKPVSTILAMPLGYEYLLQTGSPAIMVPKYRPESHPLYHELGEAQPER